MTGKKNSDRKHDKKSPLTSPVPVDAGQGSVSSGETDILHDIGIHIDDLVNNIDFGVFIVDYEGCFLFVNDTIVKNSGMPFESFIGTNYLTIIHPSYHDTVQKKFESVRTGKDMPSVELEYQSADGLMQTVEISLKSIYRSGKFIAVIGFSRNLTDRKNMERDIRESEEKHRLLAQNISDVIWTMDLNLKFTYLSPSISKLRGYSAEEVIEQPIEKMFSHEAYTQLMEIFKLEMEKEKSGTADPKRTVTIEADHVHKDGTVFPAEMVMTATRDESGKMTGIQGVTRDISRRRMAEEALRQSEHRYRFLVENAIIGLYMAEIPSGKFIFLNNKVCEMFGYTYDEAMKLHIWDVMDPAEHEVVRKRIADKMAGKIPLSASYIYNALKKDKTIFRAKISSTPVLYKGLNVVQGMVMDVTENEELQKKLFNAQKMEAVGTLAGGIAHDFNNLLMGILGNVSLMLMDSDPEKENFERLKNIQEHVQSGVELTKQLLGFARGGKYEIKPVNINNLISKSSEMFGRTHKEIRIIAKLAPDIWTVEIDPGQIEQVLLNLFVNAWQAMPEGGEIYIQTCNEQFEESAAVTHAIIPGKYVKISVTDTGRGMDTETIERIFDPFFTTKEIERGTGLGLSSAYGIIKNHGGIISASSSPGKGSTFLIHLHASDKKVEEDIKTNSSIHKGAEKILIVDDEDMVLTVSREMLKRLGYVVLTAKSGTEALEIYGKDITAVDLVILDMIMPDMEGEETYIKLKEMDSNVRVLLSSGYTLDGQAQKIMSMGCNGFIQKPYTIEQISAKIREILNMD